MSIMCVHGTLRDQKRSSDSLELELRTVVNHHGCAGNVTSVLCETNACSQPLSHFSALQTICFT